jgi:hypothetical protein
LEASADIGAHLRLEKIMNSKEARNRQFLCDLFAGKSRSHGIVIDPVTPASPHPGDYSIAGTALEDWLPNIVQHYEDQVAYLEALDLDSVPTARMITGTGVFASAFGCALHLYPDTPAAARPLVFTPQEADKLRVPSLDAPAIARVFMMAERVEARLGKDVSIGVPDIQSAFDIAALIWNKQDMFVAMHEAPEAVITLADKCQALLKQFFDAYFRRFPQCNPAHYPNAWSPLSYGIWLSEDEAGALSVPMFERFCLPLLDDLSDRYGGLVMHCCATADHQYGNFRKIRRLRGINRFFQKPGPLPAIQAFSGRSVLIISSISDEENLGRLLDMALPETRYLFALPGMSLEQAKRINDFLRQRCPRMAPVEQPT